MKTELFIRDTIIFLIIFNSGCDKSKTTSCILVSSAVITKSDVSVTYYARGSGNSEMLGIFYVADSGTNLNLAVPYLPYSFTVKVDSGVEVHVQGTGTADNGGLSVGLQFTDGNDFIEKS